MRLLAFAVSFVLAFLLFAVQPMATKMVLPSLGGTPAVWNTVMFTFQLLLLAGYCYAHLLTRHGRTRTQLLVHGALMLVTLLFLPLAVHLTTSDALVNAPIRALVGAFLVQLGLPFFCLAATAPLLQSWVSRSAHPLSKTPYVLYSASNFGSFAGLLGYVGIVEPLLDLHQQSVDWSWLYALGMITLLLTGLALRPRDLPNAEHADSIRPRTADRLQWVALAFLPSSLSLGVTTYIATDVASVPLLWVIPLSLYLLSFVDAFRTKPILVRGCQRHAPLMGLAALILYGAGGVGFVGGYLFQLLTFAALAFAIHGWLAQKQPATRYLTQFYVCLSIGGALGGVLNGLIAPLIFRSAFEYPIVLLLATLTAFMLMQRRENIDITIFRHLRRALYVLGCVLGLTFAVYMIFLLFQGMLTREMLNHPAFNGLTLMKSASIAGLLTLTIERKYTQAFYTCASVIMIMLFVLDSGVVHYQTLFRDRNFFGVERIYENSASNARYLMHDTTMHGLQSLDADKNKRPVAYYGALNSIFHALPVAHEHPIGVIGLGIGAVKCLALPQQQVDFYEINPMVKMLAEDPHYFIQLRDCAGSYTITLGDGRIRVGEAADGRYGIMVLDAFSSDAIPSHLLTREALALYLSKLAPGGVLVIHTTNRHIDLWPLLAAQSKALGVVSYGKFFDVPKDDPLLFKSHWVVMAKSPADLQPLIGHDTAWHKLEDEGDRPWTDQYINLLPYFKFLR